MQAASKGHWRQTLGEPRPDCVHDKLAGTACVCHHHIPSHCFLVAALVSVMAAHNKLNE
jgi:hypothetical protein